MSNNLGMGVMIGMLGGNAETIAALDSAKGHVISSARLTEDKLVMVLDDTRTLRLWDDGQSCCERRYMMTDDNLDEFVGARIVEFGLKEAPEIAVAAEDGEPHEVQFLVVKTDLGDITMATHNEHNGYYGGFWIVADVSGEATS